MIINGADLPLPCPQVLIKFDHLVFTAAITMNLWLIPGDDYLLIFWQIHALVAAYFLSLIHI